MIPKKRVADFRNSQRKVNKGKIRQMHKMKNEITENLTAVIHKEDDVYVAECPEVGTVSQGKTVNNAIANLKEATELYLEGFPLKSKKRAIMATFEVTVGGKA